MKSIACSTLAAMRRALSMIAVLVACRGKGAPPPSAHEPPPGKASSVDPWSATPDAQPDTPALRKARADAALGRVASIIPKLAKLRDLALLRPIPAEYQTNEQFRAFVHREVEKERAKDKDLADALLQIGLLPAPLDLARAEEQAFATQAAAYYDPAQKKFFLVMVPDSPTMLDAISAHELTHGLQDQHFDLQKYVGEDDKGAAKLDDDAQTARRFIVEGDATFAMFLYAIADATDGKGASAQVLQMLRGQLESASQLDSAAMVDSLAATTGLGSGDMAESMRAMREIPRTILVPMIESYTRGALVALDAYERGGWRAVDALYKDPPESTEQVLHPEAKLLVAHRDRPRRVTLAKLDGFDEVTGGVLGELQWRVYFSLWKHDGGDDVSSDWGGDRYALLRGKDGARLAVIATVWDTPEAAKRFAVAYGSTIAERTKVAAHQGAIAMRVDGARVLIVDGSDDAKLLDALARGVKVAP